MNPTKDPSIRSADRGRLEAEAPCHYDAKYFAQQSKTGWFRGWADLSKFGRYIGGDMKVIDFGCGGEFLLANISCREKIGIEINPAARAEAGRNGVRTVGSAGEIEDGWADLIVSNHALEHCREPLRELMDLLPKLAVVVPNAEGAICYQWHQVDKVLDALLGMQLRPFVELGPMPAALASGTQTFFVW